MSTDARGFSRIFAWLMGLAALLWIWTVALLLAWPWQKDVQWQEGDRIVALCPDQTVCSIAQADLGQDPALVERLAIPSELGDAGDADEGQAWLKWRREAPGKDWQWEVTQSSWHFETVWRYRIDNQVPVLIARRHIDIGLVLYAIPLALLTLAGLALRTLRQR